MRRPRALVLKAAALQVGRRAVPQVVQPAELQVVQPAELQVVQPAELQAVQPVELQVVQPVEALQVVPLAVQPVPVRQAQLEPRVLLEQRVPQARLLVRSPGLLALWASSVR